MNKYIDEELKCDACGMLYSEFLKTGVFGCPNCYRVFKCKTVDILKKEIIEKETIRRAENRSVAVKSNFSKQAKNKGNKIKELKQLLLAYENNNDIEMIEKIKQELQKLEKNEIDY